MTAEVHSVAHVVSSLNVGGAERLVVDLSQAQLRDGLAVTILDLGADERPLGKTARSAGVEVVRIGQRRSRWVRLASTHRGRGTSSRLRTRSPPRRYRES